MLWTLPILVLYTILALGVTMGAGGEPDGRTGSDIGVKYNVVSETLKILSVSAQSLCSSSLAYFISLTFNLSVHNPLPRRLPQQHLRRAK